MKMRFFGSEGIEIGNEMAAYPVHVDKRLHPHLLLEHGLVAADRVGVACPRNRLVGNTE
ncbi:unannotated protein [freshwater metagenome]|uniref:Unannotated protein n=1 Tax=freshwater metagenome TaxID=449393 RepID=A0A6J6H935_9ZZZZ